MTDQKPVIEFESYRITNIDFRVYDDVSDIDKLNITEGNINASVSVDDNFEYARLKISTTIVDKENLRTILAEITGFFHINEEDQQKAEKYIRLNGTAILLPYLRTTISILTSLDNKDAVILPTINTHNFSDADK